METKQPVPRAILVGIQLDGVDDVAYEASLKELGQLVETLGYEVAGSVSQKRDGIGGLTLLGKGKLAELAAITDGTGVVGGWTAPQKSKSRARFEIAEAEKPDVPAPEPQADGARRREFIIVDHEISPSQSCILWIDRAYFAAVELEDCHQQSGPQFGVAFISDVVVPRRLLLERSDRRRNRP